MEQNNYTNEQFPPNLELKQLPLDRLPTTAEIRSHRGFPDKETESKYQELFFKNFRDKAQTFAKEKLHWNNPTENQTQLFLSYLYGIYFVNIIVGGKIIDKDFNKTQKTKWILQPSNSDNGLSRPDLDVENLNDWPIEMGFNLSFDNPHIASADSVSRKIQIYPDQIKDENPNNPSRGGNINRLEIIPGIGITLPSESTNVLPRGLRTILEGIEEAMHVYSSYIEETNYGLKRTNDNSESQGPLINIRGRDSAKKSIVDYYSELGDEFSAHIVRSQYLKRYFPEIYDKGIRKFDLMIRKARKQKVKAAS